MYDVTRRRFLTRSSIGIALAGSLAVVPGLSGVLKQPALGMPIGSQSNMAGPLVAHVKDLASGEISIMVGTNEVIERDRDLANRLFAAAHRAGR